MVKMWNNIIFAIFLNFLQKHHQPMYFINVENPVCQFYYLSKIVFVDLQMEMDLVSLLNCPMIVDFHQEIIERILLN